MAKVASVRTWLHGLGAAVIGGASTTGAMMLVDPKTYNLEDLHKLGHILIVSGLLNAFCYLKQSPLPPEMSVEIKTNENPSNTVTK